MKKLLSIFLFLFTVSVSAQQFTTTQSMGTPKTIVKSNGGLGADSGYVIPGFADTTAANRGKLDEQPGLLIRAGNTLWLRNATATGWVNIGEGADSTLFATLYRLDTMRTNLYQQLGLKLNITDTSGKWIGIGWLTNLMKYADTASKTWDWSDITGKPTLLVPADTVNKYVTTFYRKPGTDSVFFTKGGAHTFAFIDSVGSGGGSFTVDSIRYNATTGTITLYQTGASDLSTYINSSYLLFDSTFSPLGGSVNDSTAKVKSGRIQLNGSTVTPTVTDSTLSWNIQALVAADTASLSSRINQKLNISDTTSKTWDWGDITGKPATVSGYGITDAIDSLRRVGGSVNVEARKNGVWITQYTDSVGSGGGGSPAGNYGNIQLNRNGAFATPASDSLNFSAGLAIKGTLSATALPTGGVAADSVVVVSSAGALKKRNSSAFVTTNGSTATGQFSLFNGSGTVYSSSKFVYSDALYPSMSIVGSDPLMYFGGTGAAYPSFGKAGNSTVIYGSSSGKSIGFFDQLVGGKQMLRLYTTSGSVAVFNKTAITVDTAVGGPSIGSIHAEYNAGDSTSIATDVGRHMFRGIGRTYANGGSFNTFYSTVEAGNTTYSQDHIISWQSDAKKTGANTLNIIYHLGILGDSIKAGTVNNRWGVCMYDAKVTAGATLAHQSALRVPKLASAVRNYDMFSDSAQTVKMDGNFLIGDSSLATGARKTIHLFNGTAPSSNISGSILYSESGEFKVRNSSGAINTLSGNAVFSGTITTADPASGAGAWRLGVRVASSGLTLDDTQYIEISIGGTVYKLALVNVP